MSVSWFGDGQSWPRVDNAAKQQALHGGGHQFA